MHQMRSVSHRKFDTYVELLQQGYVVENILKKIFKEQKKEQKHIRDSGSFNQQLKPIGSPAKDMQQKMQD